ncbi:hypothetical protein GQ457_04G012360 [Hibiscus cannabinus]
MESIHPSQSWICLNTDDAVSFGSKSRSIGDIFRDSFGSLISSFAKHLGIIHVKQAEFWGVLEGLKQAWELAFEHIHV